MLECIRLHRSTIIYLYDSTLDEMMISYGSHRKTFQTIAVAEALQIIILVLYFQQANSDIPSLRYSRHCGKFCLTCFSGSRDEEVLESYRYNPFSGRSAQVSLINVCEDQIMETPKYGTGPLSQCLVMKGTPTTTLICDLHPSHDELQTILAAHLLHTDVIEDIDIDCSREGSCWCLHLNNTDYSDIYCHKLELVNKMQPCSEVSVNILNLYKLQSIKSIILKNIYLWKDL